jgi:imidazolonepropionase-like amidohydrolase
MTHRFDALLALTAVALLVVPAAPHAQSGALVLRNVTLIDGTGGAAGPGMTVIVMGNRISAVGRDLPPPPGARVVDGTGKS